jgi:beta-glucosidase
VEKGKKYNIELQFAAIFEWVDASLNFAFGKEIPVNYDELANKLKGIDIVVFVGGLTSKLEGEEMPIDIPGFKGGDRTNIELPGSQRKYLQALKRAGKKVIFVNCTGSAVALTPEIESCDAILQAWYGGQAGGQAVADVLFGDYNPSGKLPISFYRNSDQLGDFEDYSMKGKTYRFNDDLLFPFGFGLSYTSFKIGDAQLSKISIKADESIQLTVPIRNTGKRNGTEVVQVYVRKVGDNDGPIKTLRAFKRVEILAGKESTVSLNLAPAAFEFYDRSQRKMAVTAGEYEVLYGNSSAIGDLKKTRITIL